MKSAKSTKSYPNRLRLDFSLQTQAERTEFVKTYLSSSSFQPTESELETISTYILWGTNPSGENLQSEGLAHLKDWTATPTESLDSLVESETFQEISLRPLTSTPLKVTKTALDRDFIRRTCPGDLIGIYEKLWQEIDTVELTINFYDIQHAKRTKPPRDELLGRFTAEDISFIQADAAELTQYKYLKLKHLLVELRTSQYTYYDFHSEHIISHYQSMRPQLASSNLQIGTDVDVYPLGLFTDQPFSKKIFNMEAEPTNFSEEELSNLSSLLWKNNSSFLIDFTNPSHILEIYKLRAELMDEQERDPAHFETDASYLIRTLDFYEAAAALTPIQKFILDRKLHNASNIVIAEEINRTYQKTYNDNYISTLFHQKILTSIAAAASNHRKLMENIFYPENFKQCKDCGRLLLLNSTNFTHLRKTADGYAPRCKACEKIKRSKYYK